MRLLAFLDMCQSQYNLLLGLRLCGLAWSNENGKPQEMLTTWLKSELLSFSVCYLLFVIIDCRMFEYLLYESFICSAPKWINRKKSRHMSTIVPKWKYYTFILRQAWRTLWNPNYRCINYIFSHHFGCLAGILETKSRICIFFGIVDIGHVGWIVFAINPALPSCSSACQKLIDCDAKNNKNWYPRQYSNECYDDQLLILKWDANLNTVDVQFTVMAFHEMLYSIATEIRCLYER